MTVFDTKIRTKLPWRSGRKHLQSLYASLEQQQIDKPTDLSAVFKEVQESYPSRCLTVLITDFLGADLSTLRGLAALRQSGHDCLVFHVMDDDELDFPFNDPTRFEGMESIDQLACNPRALREGYLESLQKFLDRVRRTCASNKIDYQLTRTSRPMDATLTAFLAARMAYMRKR